MIQAERTIVTPCCARELVIQLRIHDAVLPTVGDEIDVACPHCQETLTITMLSGLSNN